MAGNDILAAALNVAAQTGVAPAVLIAVAKVETASQCFAIVGSRREPLISFEGHWFDRLMPAARRAQARAAGLSDPKAGAVRNPASQAARWRLLDKAAAIDAEAAYSAVSWGLGQVMGLHWKRLGFASATALAAEARRSPEGQLLLVARFLKLGGLDRMLRERRFEDFARSYNGPAFKANRYDAKLKAAFVRAEALVEAGTGPSDARPATGKDAESSPEGWAGLASRLSFALQWLFHRPPTPIATLSSSISTARSSSSRTTRRPWP